MNEEYIEVFEDRNPMRQMKNQKGSGKSRRSQHVNERARKSQATYFGGMHRRRQKRYSIK